MNWWNATAPIITAVVFKIIGAIVLYLIGRWLIGLSARLLSRVLGARHFDATLTRYVVNILSVGLTIVLIVAILGYFGVETTSFAALLAGVGLAVGAAWSGLLANFAAGAFLIIFRPYKVGDYVVAGGVEGTVMEIGLFNTTLLTPDSVTTIVGNAKVSGDTIKNFTTHEFRRVDRTAQLAFGVDPLDAIGEPDRRAVGPEPGQGRRRKDAAEADARQQQVGGSRASDQGVAKHAQEDRAARFVGRRVERGHAERLDEVAAHGGRQAGGEVPDRFAGHGPKARASPS